MNIDQNQINCNSRDQVNYDKSAMLSFSVQNLCNQKNKFLINVYLKIKIPWIRTVPRSNFLLISVLELKIFLWSYHSSQFSPVLSMRSAHSTNLARILLSSMANGRQSPLNSSKITQTTMLENKQLRINLVGLNIPTFSVKTQKYK